MYNDENKKRKKRKIELYWLWLIFIGIIFIINGILHTATFGYDKELTVYDVGVSCIIAAISCGIVLVYQLYKHYIIDRFLLAIGVWITGAAAMYLLKIDYLAYYYTHYSEVIAFGCIIAIGIITTFLTPAGFVGVMSDDKELIRKESLGVITKAVLFLISIMVIQYYWNARYTLFAFLIIFRTIYDEASGKVSRER